MTDAAMSDEKTPVVDTVEGQLQGRMAGDIHCFKGVRYGADTGGRNRFRPPQPVAPWDNVYQAISFGPDSPQSNPASEQPMTSDAAVQVSGIEGEDCLCLNVWTPALSGKRPVMVWLHGGGFVSGSGSGLMYDGKNLSTRGDVVVVTVNHRLGVLGYMNLDGIVDSDEPIVNLGMLDLVACLEWVRDNIANFGGDPGNVLIFGESGGGRKVSTLLAMPRAQGLFHKAVVQSGPAVFMNDYNASHEVSTRILDELGTEKPTLDELQSMSLERLLLAQHASLGHFANDYPGIAQPLAAVVDGKILPHHPFHPEAPSISDDIPVMVGWNQTEATLWMIRDLDLNEISDEKLQSRIEKLVGDRAAEFIDKYKAGYPDANNADLLALITTGRRKYPLDSQLLAERKAARGAAPCYLYTLTYRTTARRGALRTPHALEIPFVFDNIETSKRFVGEGDGPAAMAEQMSSSWIAFAKTGDPNNQAIPSWPPYSVDKRESMVFNVESAVAGDFASVERDTYGDFYYGKQ
jgi:para-nitrobenzyl esterase